MRPSITIAGETSIRTTPVPIKLTLRCVNNPDLSIDNVPADDTIGNLKVLIESRHGIIHSLQRLIYNGTELNDSDTLLHLGIHDGSTVHIVVRKVPPVANAVSEAIPTSDSPFYAVLSDSTVNSYPTVDGTRALQVGEVRLHIDVAPGHRSTQSVTDAIPAPEGTRIVSIQRVKVLRRTVMLMALISMAISFIFSTVSTPWWLILALLGLTGFQGARTLRRDSIFLFMMVESSILLLLMMLLYDVFDNSDVSTETIIVLVAFIGIQTYTVVQSWNLYSILRGVNPDQVLRVLIEQ